MDEIDPSVEAPRGGPLSPDPATTPTPRFTDEPQMPEAPPTEVLSTFEDVENCYRLILARAPESAEVVLSRTGQPLRAVIAGFAGGEEFGERVVRPLLMNGQLPESYDEVADAALHAWVMKHTGRLVAEGATIAHHLAPMLERLAVEDEGRPPRLLEVLAQKLRERPTEPPSPTPLRAPLVEALVLSSENDVARAALAALALLDVAATPSTAAAIPGRGQVDDRALLRGSGLWDPEYYVSHNAPDLGPDEGDTLQHFLTRGGVEGLRPHPLFSAAGYNAHNPDVASAGVNPLVHYLRHGWKEGRRPNALFDPGWYVRRYAVATEPLGHYALQGRSAGLKPHPLFDAGRYLAENPDLLGMHTDPYTHYVEYGIDEGRRPYQATRLGDGLEVAVVVHVFYEELWPEISRYLRQIPRRFDLFITLPLQGAALRAAILKDWPQAQVVESPNVGRDIGPFLAVLPELRRYDAVCKLHTKKGATDPAMWRLLTLEGLLGSADLVGSILGWFEEDPALVLVGPNKFYMDGPWTLDANGSALAQALRAVRGYEAPFPADWGFFAGSMFWFRPSLFTNFPTQTLIAMLEMDENVANDSQAAHAIERLLGMAAALADGAVGLTDVAGVLPPREPSVTAAGATPTSRDGLATYLPRRRAELAPARVELRKAVRRSWLAPAGTAPGVNFVGPVEAVNGLGVSARGFVQALRGADLPVNVVPWRIGFDRVRLNPFDSPACPVQPITMVHVNLDLLTGPRLLERPPLSQWVSPERYNIAVIYWELPTILPVWRWAIDFFDEVWTSSSFARDAVAASSDVITRIVRPVVELARDADPAAAPILGGATPGAYTFFYSADAGSVLSRKNPEAFWRAYAAEFRPDEGARCVVKLSYADAEHPLVRELSALSSTRPDVVFISDLLSSGEMAQLFQECDCYVSPHRSEGLGLTLLEAMEAGKPVVSSRFGGVSDFVTEDTAFVVDHRLTEVGPDSEPYPAGFVWADPDPNSLRRRLRQVFSDQTQARRVGERGRRQAYKLFSEAAAADAVGEELKRIWRKGGGSWPEAGGRRPL